MKSGKSSNYLPVSLTPLTNSQNKVAAASPQLTQALKESPADLLTLLKSGQKLSATVVKQLATESILQLKVGSTLLNLRAELKLPVGTLIKLEFLAIGANKTPEFKLLSLPPAENSATLSQALKQALPRQLSLSSLLAQLHAVISDKKPTIALPKEVVLLVKKIISDIPQKEQLQQPNELKKRVFQSGIFLEKNLKLTDKEISSPLLREDQKAKLLMLLSSLQVAHKKTTHQLKVGMPASENTKAPSRLPELLKLKSPTELMNRGNKLTPATAQQTALLTQLSSVLKDLIGKTEGGIAKIVLDQLFSLPKEENAKQSWQLELPFHSGSSQAESLKLVITQEGKNSAANHEPSWTVVLEITPPNLATIYSKITLKGNQVDSYFWSEEPRTCNLIDHHLDDLEKRLSSVGLETGQLGTRLGKPVEANRQKPEKQLVSERA
jgi:hypothetical protein